MGLDEETRAALGFGCAWTQLALRWPLYLVKRAPLDGRELARRREREAADRRARGIPAREFFASDAERLEATRRRKREHMQRVRAAAK